ncbi:MAG TPA: hypothetical protein VJH94_02920 [Candidatus Paceibacterota bacterium]
MKRNGSRKNRKKHKKALPRLSEQAYKDLKRLFEYHNDEHSFDENPTEMLEYLLATIKEYEEKKMYDPQSGSVRMTLYEAFDPDWIENRRREKSERLHKKAA